MTDQQELSTLQRLRAYTWYAWGSSLSYWGVTTAEKSFYRSAVRAFERATRVWPEFGHAFYRSGIIRGRELREYEQGVADLTRAIVLDPQRPEPHLQRGLIQRFHGDQRAALDDLRRFLALGGSGPWRAEAERQIAAIEAEQALGVGD